MNLFRTIAGAWVLAFVISSCSSDKDGIDNPDQRESSKGMTITLNLETETPDLTDLNTQTVVSPSEEGKSEVRSWTDDGGFPFKVVDAENRYIRNSDGDALDGSSTTKSKVAKIDKATLLKENPTREILVMVRKQGVSEYAYKQATWRYNADLGIYEIKGLKIDLPSSMGTTLSSSDTYYTRVVTGAKYDDVKKTLEVSESLSEMDLSETTTLKAKIPFASAWVKADINERDQLLIAQNSDEYSVEHRNRMTLKPLGSLLLISFRNTGDDEVTFSKIRLLSNAQLFAGKYDLTKETLVCEAPDSETDKGYEIRDIAQTGDRFREKTLALSSTLTLPKQTNRYAYNNKIFVLWTAPVGGKSSVGGSLGGTIQGAQTMIYAVDAKKSDGEFIKYPNYAIAPIMGTNRLMENGKTYAMNCEFYKGALPLLGFYAKYTVNESGDGFDTSHDNDKVSLVHYTKARPFMQGVKLTNPTTKQQNTYYMGQRGSAALLTLLWGIPFDSSSGFSASSDETTEYAARVPRSYPNLTLRNGEYTIEEISRNWYYTLTSKRKSPHDGVAYVLVGRYGTGPGDAFQSTKRSNSQAFYRVEAIDFKNGKLGGIKIKSFATGKYFVGGTYTPIYQGKMIMDETLWNDGTVLQGGWAERIIPAPGNYKTVTSSDYESTSPATTTRENVGDATYYWWNSGYATNYLMAWYSHKGGVLNSAAWGRPAVSSLPQEFSFNQQFIDAFNNELAILKTRRQPTGTDANGNTTYYNIAASDILTRAGTSIIGYKGLNGSAGVGVGTDSDGKASLTTMSPYLWLALLPFSDTYQGDSAD